jgi:hypothetical protein
MAAAERREGIMGATIAIVLVLVFFGILLLPKYIQKTLLGFIGILMLLVVAGLFGAIAEGAIRHGIETYQNQEVQE